MADSQLAALLAQQASILDGVQKTLGRLEERDKDAASSLKAVNDRITADIAADKLERDATLASMKESFEAMKKSLEEVSNRPPPGSEEAKESPSTPSDITDFSTFHKGKLSKADQDHFSTSYGELSKGIGMNNLYHDTGLKIFTAVYNGKGTMENIGDLRKCISRYIEVHSLNKARRILDVKSYYSYTQGHDKFTDWINSSLVNAYSSAMNAIIGLKIDVTQLSGLQILKIDDVQLDESSARGEQVILWDKVPIDLFTKEKFLKDPFKYITEEGFKSKDQKFVISKILKHDKDLEMKTLSFHCIPMNFGDRTNEHQPGYVPLNPFFDSYRNCLFKAGMNQSAEDRRYAPMSSMIPGDVNFNPAEHMDLTDFGSSDTVVSENLYAYLNNSFRNLSQKDKSELLSAEMENIRKISMGCKSYALVQWVLSVLCGGQESILLHLQDYRKDVLDATTGAFSEFPLLDPNNIMKFVYQLNEKIGSMSNYDTYAYRTKKELMREVIPAMWRHVSAAQWQNSSDEPASALHEKIFKITDALRVFYGNSHHRDSPSSLKALEAAQVGLSHAIYDIKLMIDMFTSLYAAHYAEPPDMNECLSLDLDNTQQFKHRSRLSQAQFSLSLKNAGMYQVEELESCTFYLNDTDMDEVNQLYDACDRDETILSLLDETTAAFAANCVSVHFTEEQIMMAGGNKSATPGFKPKATSNRQKGRLKLRNRGKGGFGRGSGGFGRGGGKLHSTSSFNQIERKVVNLSSNDENDPMHKRKEAYIDRMKTAVKHAVPRSSQQARTSQRESDFGAAHHNVDVRDESNVPKTSMALQKFIYTQIKNGTFNQLDDDVKKELEQLQKATFKSLKTANVLEATDFQPDDVPEETMAAVYHRTGGELLSETKETILTMEELEEEGNDSSFPAVMLTDTEMSSFRD